MKKSLCLLSLIGALIFLSQCASTPDGKTSAEKQKVSTTNRMGYVMPKYNFSVDAEYVTQTARLIPGYTAVTVAVVNKGFHPILMRPDKDRWRLKDRKGKWHKGINDMQYEASEQWQRLQQKTQKVISYPITVPPGYTQTFSLFFSGEHNLAGFKKIEFYNENWQKTFTFTRY